MYQHQVMRRCRVRAVTCCVAATSSRGLCAGGPIDEGSERRCLNRGGLGGAG